MAGISFIATPTTGRPLPRAAGRLARVFGREKDGRRARERRGRAPQAEQLVGPPQKLFYDTFGYLKLAGVFTEDMPRITQGFGEAVSEDGPRLALDPGNAYHHVREGTGADTARTIIPAFIDQSDSLSWIRTDPRVEQIVEGLLGPDVRYAESDGNVINCDVRWHTDVYGVTDDAPHLKLFFYLDPLRAETGALRTVPGSHADGQFAQEGQRAAFNLDQLPERWGCSYEDVPSFNTQMDVLLIPFRIIPLIEACDPVKFYEYCALGKPTVTTPLP